MVETLISLKVTSLTLGTLIVGVFIHVGRLHLPLDTSRRDCSLGPGKVREDFVKLLKLGGKKK